MKPLLATKTNELLTRIDSAVGGELRSVVMNSPVSFTIELSVQDANRGNDWINIAFEVDGVSNARLIDDEKLSFVDMGDGISLIFENGSCAIAVGKYHSLEAMESAVLYLKGSSIKYEERLFNN